MLSYLDVLSEPFNCNLLMHLAAGIIKAINYRQKNKTDGKTLLVKILAALSPLVTCDWRGWVLFRNMAAYCSKERRSS